MASKYCPTCDKTHPVSEFGKDSSNKDGLYYQCRISRAKRSKELKGHKQNQALPSTAPSTFNEKECPGCHEVKPADEYYCVYVDACGVYEFCRSCCPSPSGTIGKNYHKKKIVAQGDILLVELTQNTIMKCDNSPEAWYLLQQHNWHAHNEHGAFYATTCVDGKTTKFHDLIMNCFDGEIVDHLHQDTLDNRRIELRCADYSINARNTKLRVTNTSGIKGVCFDTCTNSWRAFARDNNQCDVSRSFSIRKYGDTEAKEMATQQRLAWEKEFGYMPAPDAQIRP